MPKDRWRAWLDRSLTVLTAALVVVAVYTLAKERLIPALRDDPVPVVEGDRLDGAVEFEPLADEGVPRLQVPAPRSTLLLVYSSACPACYSNLPAWRQVMGRAGATRMLAVALQRDRAAAAAYARRHLPEARPVAPVDPRRFVGRFGIEVVPFTALVGEDGVVEFIWSGSLDSVAVGALARALDGRRDRSFEETW